MARSGIGDLDVSELDHPGPGRHGGRARIPRSDRASLLVESPIPATRACASARPAPSGAGATAAPANSGTGTRTTPPTRRRSCWTASAVPFTGCATVSLSYEHACGLKTDKTSGAGATTLRRGRDRKRRRWPTIALPDPGRRPRLGNGWSRLTTLRQLLRRARPTEAPGAGEATALRLSWRTDYHRVNRSDAGPDRRRDPADERGASHQLVRRLQALRPPERRSIWCWGGGSHHRALRAAAGRAQHQMPVTGVSGRPRLLPRCQRPVLVDGTCPRYQVTCP